MDWNAVHSKGACRHEKERLENCRNSIFIACGDWRDWAFCECRKLNRIFIPDSVYEIGEGAFCNCAQLDEVEIPDSVIKLDDCVFRGCTGLERVVIPSSVKELGWGLFDGCEHIVTVYCDEGSAAHEYCLRNDIRHARIAEKEAD